MHGCRTLGHSACFKNATSLPCSSVAGRTLKLIVVLVVDIAVGAGTATQEALFVRRLHVNEELVVAVKALPTELALRMPLEAALRHWACQIAAAHVALQLWLAVCDLLWDENLQKNLLVRIQIWTIFYTSPEVLNV